MQGTRILHCWDRETLQEVGRNSANSAVAMPSQAVTTCFLSPFPGGTRTSSMKTCNFVRLVESRCWGCLSSGYPDAHSATPCRQRDEPYHQLTSAAFCSSGEGIDRSSTAESSANATAGDSVVTAAIEASDVLRKADLSHGDDVSHR